jgi:hypothetical protein
MLEISGNFLNDIINAAAGGDNGNSRIQDDLNETSNDVNLQTNESNRRCRLLHMLLRAKQEHSTTKAGNEGNIVEIKSIPYKSHKHVLNSMYEPKHKNTIKYSNPHEQKSLAESSDQFPSTIITVHNTFSPSDERSDAIKMIFSTVYEQFPHINNNSQEFFESAASHDTSTISEETSRNETEHSEVSQVPSATTNSNNTYVDISTEPNVNKQGNGSLVILQTYSLDNLNNLSASNKNVTNVEQKTHDTELVPNNQEQTAQPDTGNRSTEHEGTGTGQQQTDYIHRENKPTSTVGHINTFIKNIPNNVVKYFHNIPPWNYFSPEQTIRPL